MTKNMILLIGLGNPGSQYKNTRHNVGFMAIDKFAEKNNFPEFKVDKKSNSLVSEKDGVVLVKPQTFMNESGKAIRSLARSYKLKAKSLVIVHDDIDLPLGKIKIVKERGSAGHKGVESIIKSVGNDGLARIRIGIAPCLPAQAENKTKAIKVVLKNFSPEEKDLLEQSLDKTTAALNLIIEESLASAMNEFNK